MKKVTIIFFFAFIIHHVAGQSLFNAVYPIGESPNIGYKTSMVPKIEKMIFEANPIVRLPLLNNIQRNLQNDRMNASAIYFNFKPQIRMYKDNSKPVRMPSYNIGLAYQHLLRLKHIENAFLAFSVESGHYSNGQDRSTFDENLEDGSIASDALYDVITDESDLSAMLNRKSGNFSTNFTEFNIKYIKSVGALNDVYKPTSTFSVQLGYNRYHDRLLLVLPAIGGYTENDIKIYGKNRWKLAFDYMNTFHKEEGDIRDWSLDTYVIATSLNYIYKPHAWVDPLRTEITGTVYFANNMGIFLSGIYGHDNYNYRFVDHGFQVFAGLTFDVFPRIQWKR